MAFKDFTEKDVYDLRDRLEDIQGDQGHSEFIEGAMAVCEWLTEGFSKPSVEGFLKDNDLP